MTEKANVPYSPLILGVEHEPEQVSNTLEIIEQFGLRGRNVMLEIPEYPMPDDLLKKDGYVYFNEVARQVVERGGAILAGDASYLMEHANQRLIILDEVDPSAARNSKTREEVLSLWRDPHFLKRAQEEQPDVIILHKSHAAYVAEYLGVECRGVERA